MATLFRVTGTVRSLSTFVWKTLSLRQLWLVTTFSTECRNLWIFEIQADTMSRQKQACWNCDESVTISPQKLSHIGTPLKTNTFRLFTGGLDAASWSGAIT